MYLLSILSVIVMVVVVCATSWGMNASYIIRFFDAYTVLWLVLFLVPLLISGGLLKDFNNAFRLGIGKKEAASLIELKRAKESVSLTIKILIAVAVFITSIQSIFILYNMDDPAMLGPSFSVAILTFVYVMGITLILLPLQARLNVRIQEYISEKE